MIFYEITGFNLIRIQKVLLLTKKYVYKFYFIFSLDFQLLTFDLIYNC